MDLHCSVSLGFAFLALLDEFLHSLDNQLTQPDDEAGHDEKDRTVGNGYEGANRPGGSFVEEENEDDDDEKEQDVLHQQTQSV